MTENSPNPDLRVAPAAPNSRFSELEIEQGLMALALCSGNARKAERRLAELGMKVDHSTLHRWKDRHSEKYLSLQREILPKLREEAAERHSAVADREMELGLELLDQLQAKKADLPARDLSTAIRNLDVGQGTTGRRPQSCEGMHRRPRSASTSLPLFTPWLKRGPPSPTNRATDSRQKS
jgi:hypothetical protein